MHVFLKFDLIRMKNYLHGNGNDCDAGQNLHFYSTKSDLCADCWVDGQVQQDFVKLS